MRMQSDMKVSVIVPVRDEQETIRELLDGLLNQTRLPNEIVITDGGSVDSTTEIIEQYIQKGAPVRLIRAGAALPGRGRNLAAAESRFEWLAFIDAGIRPARDWLEVLVKRAAQDESIDVIYGSWEPVTNTFFKECAAIAYVPPPTQQHGVLVRPRFIASTLLRRTAWEKVKGFPEHLRSGEDLVFMDRVEAAGFHFVHEPEANVHWELKPTLTSTFKRFVVYARNNIRAGLWKQWQSRILSRYVFILLLFLGALFVGSRWLWIPLLILLLMLGARAVVSIRRNRFCYPASLWRNLRRGILLMLLIAVLDTAAIVGSIQWLLLDWIPWSRKTPVEASNGA
jgi:glycosyltransferase involved in cell wall biosynthesis